MKEINLEEILAKIFEPKFQDCSTTKQDLQLAITLNPDLNRILEAMKQACSKVLDLAAENAVGKVDLIYGENLEYPSCEEVAVIDKNSILQIKDWIK